MDASMLLDLYSTLVFIDRVHLLQYVTPFFSQSLFYFHMQDACVNICTHARVRLVVYGDAF